MIFHFSFLLINRILCIVLIPRVSLISLVEHLQVNLSFHNPSYTLNKKEALSWSKKTAKELELVHEKLMGYW